MNGERIGARRGVNGAGNRECPCGRRDDDDAGNRDSGGLYGVSAVSTHDDFYG